ncbi:MAG: hypothetical protein ACRD1V_00185 [Vicinamibacterales bacterium]
MERLIETALMPGRFISYNTGFAFVRDLDGAEQRLSTCLAANPAQAVDLYEIFLAGCYEKAGEIDDSSGSFGDLVGQLHCAWINWWGRSGPLTAEISVTRSIVQPDVPKPAAFPRTHSSVSNRKDRTSPSCPVFVDAMPRGREAVSRPPLRRGPASRATAQAERKRVSA